MILPKSILINENVEINLDLVYEICDNDPSLITKLAFTFLKTSTNNILKLNEFFISEDYIQLKNIAHACKSTLSVFKCSSLYDLMMNIEMLAKQKANLSHLKELVSIATIKYQSMIELLVSELELIP